MEQNENSPNLAHSTVARCSCSKGGILGEKASHIFLSETVLIEI
jgi:hypothetical protein